MDTQSANSAPQINKDSRHLCMLTLPSCMDSLLLAERVVESVCLQAKSSAIDSSAIVLAMSEALCNIIQYGYPDQENGEIIIDICISHDVLTILINDEGLEVPLNIVDQYDRGFVKMPSIDVDVDELPDSGWGVNILLLTAKEVRYSRTAVGNQLKLDFQLGSL